MSSAATIAVPTVPEAEYALCGSMFLAGLEPDAARILGLAEPDDFQNERLAAIVRAMRDVFAEHGKVDAVLLVHALRERGILEDVGGLDGLQAIFDSVPYWHGAPQYAALVRDAATRRRIIDAADATARAASSGDLEGADAALARLQAARTPDPSLVPIDIGDLIRLNPDDAEALVEGLLRIAEVMTLIGSSKSRKSWAAMGLAIAVATGGYWMGFKCRQGRVVIVDLELSPGTLSKRFRRVQEGAGVNLDDIGGRIGIIPMRGRDFTIDHLEKMAEQLRGTDLLIIDPFYRTYGPGHDENDNAAAAALIGRIQGVAAKIEAAVVIVHHLSKGGTDGRRTVDLGAGAGAVARAVDVHAVIKPDDADPNLARFDCVVRTFAPVKPFPIYFDNWAWRVADVDEVAPTTPEAFALAFGSIERRAKDSILLAATAAGMTKATATTLLTAAEESGLLVRVKSQGSNRAFYALPAPSTSLSRAQ